MIRPGFLDPESRRDLIELTRDGPAAHRLARRANALVLLDDGMSCQQAARVLLFDDDSIRGWCELFEQGGLEGLSRFDTGGRSGKTSVEQTEALKARAGAAWPRSTRQFGAWMSEPGSPGNSASSTKAALG